MNMSVGKHLKTVSYCFFLCIDKSKGDYCDIMIGKIYSNAFVLKIKINIM